MTPAPISVERLREVIAIVNGPLLSCKANDHAAWEAVSFLQDQGLALLHQLAEREADLEREQGVREDAQRQLRVALNDLHDMRWMYAQELKRAEAAERAREEATGLLREVEPEINELSNIYYSEFSNTKRERETEALHSRIAAFLAASGGA